MRMVSKILLVFFVFMIPCSNRAMEDKQNKSDFKPIDIFQLEYASDPQPSPDGKQVVYVRNFFDIMSDRQRSNLWIINSDGTNHRPLTSGNRNDFSPRWSPKGDRLLFVSSVGGSVQIYVRWMDGGQTGKLTNLLSSPSGLCWSPDGKWIAKPPEFDPKITYPLILEIHGGPFANYGDRFAAEVQMYAAAGYVVLYTNPRGSTSYGKEFGNLIHHNYPGQDYDDLMSCVDVVMQRGYIDAKNLFVTGGSGGGVLSSWIVGKTDRFRAAVVAKPVINWYSFVLTSDNYNFYYKYWFPGYPWDYPEHYLKRSPLSLVGNVSTPTMLLTGEVDYRTPISESEQYYQALKLRKVDTALVRIPQASHGIASRPSYLISKVKHILTWFENYKTR